MDLGVRLVHMGLVQVKHFLLNLSLCVLGHVKFRLHVCVGLDSLPMWRSSQILIFNVFSNRETAVNRIDR